MSDHRQKGGQTSDTRTNGDTRPKRTSEAMEDPLPFTDRKAAKQATPPSNGQVAVTMLPTGRIQSWKHEAFLGFASPQFMTKDMAVTLVAPDDVVLIRNNTIDPCIVMPFSKVVITNDTVTPCMLIPYSEMGPAISVKEETYRFVGFFTTKVTADVREKFHTVGARSIVGGLHLPGLTANKSGYIYQGADASFESAVSCSTSTIVQNGDQPALDAGIFNANFQILFHPEPDKATAAIRKKTSCPHATVDPSLGSYAILVGDRQLAPPCTGEEHRRIPMANVTNVKHLEHLGGWRVVIELSHGKKKVTATAWTNKTVHVFGIVDSRMLTTDFFRERWFAFYLVPSKPQTARRYNLNFWLYAAVQVDTTIHSIGDAPNGGAVDAVDAPIDPPLPTVALPLTSHNGSTAACSDGIGESNTGIDAIVQSDTPPKKQSLASTSPPGSSKESSPSASVECHRPATVVGPTTVYFGTQAVRPEWNGEESTMPVAARTTAPSSTIRSDRGPNGCPERELVRATVDAWKAAGIECIGREVSEEIRIRASDGTMRRLDLQISKNGCVGLVEFKNDPSDFMSACGQLTGYHHRMRSSVDADGNATEYRLAWDKGSAFLMVATSGPPDPVDVQAASWMTPPIRAWWVGCPLPL